MIKLNYNIKIGDEVTIKSLSWQVRKAKVEGTYKIINMPKDEDYALLQRESDKQLLYVEIDTLTYLMGEKVDKETFCKIINPLEYQPELGEEYLCDYFSEDREELGFCYCGWRGDIRTISMTLICCDWCYINLPWNQNKERKMIVGMPICPVLDFTCPYYEQGYCTLENPAEECDDYAMRYDNEEEDF